MLPTSPKKIFAGFQFQNKKATQELIVNISKTGRYSDLFFKYANIIPKSIVIHMEELIPSIPSIKLKILINHMHKKIIEIIWYVSCC